MEEVRAPFPWTGDAMAYAKAHVTAGVLRVDQDGTVWRCKTRTRDGWCSIAPRRVENVGGKGYLRVSLHVEVGHGLAIVMAHNLIYEVLVGVIPDGFELDHVDRNKTNNRPDNLEPVTSQENQRRAHANPDRTRPWSVKRSSADAEWRKGRRMLSEAERDRARAMRAAGSPLKDIAKAIGIGVTHAHRITTKEQSK